MGFWGLISRKILPSLYFNIFYFVRFVTSVNQQFPVDLFGIDLGEVMKSFQQLFTDGFGRFYFGEIKTAVSFHNQIDFVAVAVAPIPEIFHFVAVSIQFVEFCNRIIFIDISEQAVLGKFFCTVDVQQIAEQTGIAEVQFRTFDYSLVKILEIRFQPENNKTRLQNRQPRFGGRRRNSTVFCQIRNVQNLSGSRSTKPKKPSEIR